MKFSLILVFCLISSIIYSQSKNDQHIRKVLSEQSGAWNRTDIDGFMQGYWKNDSLKFVGKNGITYGWQQTLDHYKKSYPDKTAMGVLTFDILRVQKLSPKYYNVIGQWHLKRTIGDLGGHFTLLFKKIRGSWVIVQDHTS